MNQYKRVAVMGIEGEKGTEIAGLLTDKLFASQRFEVLDKANIDTLIKEQKLSGSALYSAEGAANVGKLLRVDGLIFGSSTNYYKEHIEKESYKDSEGGYHTTYTRTGKAHVKLSIRVTDVASSKIAATKVFNTDRVASTRKTDGDPDPIDPEPLYEGCFSEVVTKFMKVIAPYTELVTVRLQKFGYYPEDITKARQFVENGRWADAKEIFKQVLERAEKDPEVSKYNDEIAMAHYNYALGLQYTGEFDEAIKNLELAYRMVPSESQYNEQISKCKMDKKNAEKLKDQLKDQPVEIQR
jgi:tetratricopeptide (TPR) repeat protein